MFYYSSIFVPMLMLWGFRNDNQVNIKKNNDQIVKRKDSQEATKPEELYLGDPYQSDRTGLWGWLSYKNKWIILPKYESAKSFSEGLAAVQLNNKWGFVNKTGKEVTPLKYDDVRDFNEGLAAVRIGNGDSRFYKFGWVDKEGNEYWDMNAYEARQKMKNR